MSSSSPESPIVRCGDLIVTHGVTDVLLAKAYLNMIEEGTLDTVFYMARPSLQDFLTEYMTHGRRITMGCFREVDGRFEFCGLGWVFEAIKMGNYVKAEVGMVFFKSQARAKANIQFGRMMLNEFFKTHNIDVLFGYTPEQNKLALRYAQKLGFEMIGPVPDMSIWHGQLAPGWISHLSKKQWMERQAT